MSTLTENDKEIIKKMKNENYERFKALVRMHLSFELDMNVDEFDVPSHEIMYYDKGKMTKLDRLTKKIKSCTSNKAYNCGSADDISIQLNMNLIQHLRKLKEFLMDEENIKQEGIFRLTGSILRQNELRNLINSQKEYDLKNSCFTVNDCATVYKNFLSNLSEPLLTDAHYSAHCQIAELCNNLDKDSSNNKETHILHSIQLLILLLPKENNILFMDIIEMLNKTISYSKFNKMSSDTLSTLFTPHLICPKQLPPEALYCISKNMTKIISYMIEKGLQIFNVPQKLLTDIRAYFVEQKRKRTMSPECILDESISDLSTVNTVYTFIDREKTAAANTLDPTDTALAQLYAHIQSLPESSKKRKLIRQFNKENGQGTPLQFLIMNRIKTESESATRSAKSISDSIKKHIFHKNLISRTPKRSSNMSLSNLGTPNAASKPTKSRVLFQSPICNSNINLSIPLSIKKHNLHKSISSSSLLTPLSSSSSIKLNKVDFKKSLNPSTITTTTTTATATITNKSNFKLFNQNSNEETSAINSTSIIEHKDSSENITSTTEIYPKEKSSPKIEIREQLNKINDNDEDDDSSNQLQNSDSTEETTELPKFLNLKHKSEPNLSRIRFIENDTISTSTTDNSSSNSNLNSPPSTFTRRNNSMINIKVDSDDIQTQNLLFDKKLLTLDQSVNTIDSPILLNIDNYSTTNIYGRSNKNLITSTPSVFLDRRKSMSPITKSTQRMPKSMQESIMTPRSRKPVMLTTTLGSSEQNHTPSSFREEDEDDSHLIINDKQNIDENIEYRPISMTKEIMTTTPTTTTVMTIDKEISGIPSTNSLTDTFREYLLSRKVLTTSPEDSSFSSHSDDFISNNDILSETDLNESLLYCLDGNNPIDDDDNDDDDKDANDDDFKSITRNDEIQYNSNLNETNDDKQRINLMISRKRSMPKDDVNDDDDDNDDKENYYDNNQLKEKKLLIIKETYNETSI